MNKRWTKDEEINLVKQVARGKSFSDIGKEHDRSESAIKLKVQKIIFNNIIGGKSANNISNKLNLPIDTVKQYFYAYKDFHEQRKGKVNFDANLLEGETNNKQKEISQNGGSKLEHKMKKLETQNSIMKIILDNRDMKKQIKKLIKDGKIDSDIIQIIKNVGHN
jgi:DNA-binding CsgD family transcriptional regulator